MHSSDTRSALLTTLGFNAETIAQELSSFVQSLKPLAGEEEVIKKVFASEVPAYQRGSHYLMCRRS